MITRLRNRLTYANTVATLALFLALGGSSYAAISITGKNVKNGSLTGKDIKGSSLGTKQVRNGSLLAGDFKSGQLQRGPEGAQGPQGPAGAAGAPGSPGAPGLTGAAGTARAYANVRTTCPSNNCLIENSSGVSQATRPNLGVYCVRAPGISGDAVAAVATPELVGSVAPTGNVTVYVARDGGADCTAGDFRVHTYDGPAAVNGIAFNIVIP